MARQLFTDGVAHARAGEWEEARAAFARSYAIYHSMGTLLNLAKGQAETGLLVEALESYRSFVTHTAGVARARRDRQRAQAQIQSLEPRIAFVELQVPWLQANDSVVMGDVPLPRAAIDAEIPANPGEVEIAVLRHGERIAGQTLLLAEGQRLGVRLSAPRNIAASPEAVPLSPEAVAAASSVSEAESPGIGALNEEHHGSLVRSPWLWTGVGVAVVAAVVGGVLLASGGSPDPIRGDLGSGLVHVP